MVVGFLLNLKFGIAVAAGIAAVVVAVMMSTHEPERPQRARPDQGEWRTSDFREPHDPWNGTRRDRSDRSRSSSTARRRRRGKHGETYSQKEMMTDELCADLVECSICVDRIDAREEVFSCKKCYNIFHLRCIRTWAGTCLSDNGTHWTCPVCKAGNTRNPNLLVYTCMCGQTVRPTPRPGTTPHCCTKKCSQCDSPCHPGACD